MILCERRNVGEMRSSPIQKQLVNSEYRQLLFAFCGRKCERDPLANFNVMGFAINDRRHQDRAFIQSNHCWEPEYGRPVCLRVCIDEAPPGALHPFGLVTEAVGAKLARIKMRLATILADLEEELPLSGARPECLGLGINCRGFRNRRCVSHVSDPFQNDSSGAVIASEGAACSMGNRKIAILHLDGWVRFPPQLANGFQ